MCEFDWSTFGTVLGGLGAVANAGLVIWLIQVTKRYVQVNADMLATTKEALAINSGLLEATRGALAVTRQQLAGQRVERVGPVAAAIRDRLRFLRRWQEWLGDPRRHFGQIINLKHEFLPADFESARLASSKLSLSAYDEMSLAKQAIEMFAGTIVEAQQSAKTQAMTRHDGTEQLISTVTSGRDFVTEAIMHLESADRRFSTDASAGENR